MLDVIVSLLSQILCCPVLAFTALHTKDSISEELLSEKILWQVCGGLMPAGRETSFFAFSKVFIFFFFTFFKIFFFSQDKDILYGH